MKTMIYSFAMAAMLGVLAGGCSDDNDPVLTQRDWEDTDTYFASTDAMTFGTYYKPYAGYVGDPMPFYDAASGEFKIMYLQEYRPNQAGTYHPVWAVSTKDAASYTSLGELIPCGGLAEQDAAIGTGSTIYNAADNLYYTFYTGNKYQPTSSENGQVVMMATSSDFKNWTKDRTFYLKGSTDGYSKSDFRDPFVFVGDDGRYHLIVSTTKDGKGVLAEYTSSDLKAWEHQGVFMTMMWDRFYECPDVFKMGDWWYLVYSEIHAAVRRVQYFKGRTLDELKACTANDAGLWPDGHEGFLDSRGFYAGKTASDGTNRYIWGWCPTRPGNDNTNVGAYPQEPEWAGNLVSHKLIQHTDGSLTLGPVDGITQKFATVAEVKAMAQGGSVSGSGAEYTLGADSYVLFNRLDECNHVSFTATTSGRGDKFGFSFVRGTDSKKYYSVVVNPEDNDNKRKLNFEEGGEEGKGFIDGIDSYVFDVPQDNAYRVDIYTDNSVCVVYINDQVAYTNRIYGIQKNGWSVDCYSGSLKVSDLKVSHQ